MAFVLGCDNISVEYIRGMLFDGLSLGCNAGDRIGIVGANGEGKSSLLRLLAKKFEPDAGRVICSNQARIALLSQSDELCPTDTVQRAVWADTPEYVWAQDPHMREICAVLLADITLTEKVGNLSGGQRRRLDLARILMDDADVLALDEPTNHLDIAAISWLATHLKTRWKEKDGVLLVVTHDRWFLDEVCNSMWELKAGKINRFEGGFSAYIAQRVERQRLEQLAETKRQNALRRELAWLSRGAQARRRKPKFHIEAVQELISDVAPLRNELSLSRMNAARLGKEVLELREVSLAFEGKQVLKSCNLALGRQDRIGIVGANGAGKTTLLKVIDGSIMPDSGRVKTGKTVRFAHLSQRLDTLMEHADERVREVAGRYGYRKMADGRETTPAQLLERLGFTRADLNEFVRDLSGGQRRRLALMMLLCEAPNVLLLDEPGNDLDVDMLAAMEDLLDEWPSALILVSHDRYLMERVCDNFYALIDGKLRHLPRGVDEYLELLNADKSKQGPQAQGSKIQGLQTQGSKKQGVKTQSTQMRMPSLSSEQYRMKKELASCERRISTLQKKIEDARVHLNGIDASDYVKLCEAQESIDVLLQQKEELEDKWLNLAGRLSN